VPTGSPSANGNICRQPSATGAPPPPSCVRGSPTSVSTSAISPKGSLSGHKIVGEYRSATSMEAERTDGWPPKPHVEAERTDGWPPKLPVEVERTDAWQLKSCIDSPQVRVVPVEDCNTSRMLPAERVTTRSAAHIYRGVSAGEVDTALRMRKVSCGKLYEELAFLRKENTVLARSVTELEQRANEEFPQQLAEELAQLRQDNQALQNSNSELRHTISEYDEHSCHDALLSTTEIKLEELRQKQEAEAERNKDQLGLLLHQNEKLNRELEDLRRGRELASACLEQAKPEMQALKHRNSALSQEVDDLRQQLESSFIDDGRAEELSEQLEDMQKQNASLAGELQSVRGCHIQDVSCLRDENTGLQRKCAELKEEASEAAKHKEELMEQRRQSSGLMQENRRLSLEIRQLSDDLRTAEIRAQGMEEERERLESDRRSLEAERRESVGEDRRRSLEEDRRKSVEPSEDEAAASPCSHSRLKSVLTDRHATLGQLRQAIGAAEALLGEARREYAAKQLRERRASFEHLHEAIEGENEETLAEAIARARRAEVDAEDIVKGEAKLALLRSLSEEQRRAKALHELSTRQKKLAYLLVKKDDADALLQLIQDLDGSVRWQDWRDYMGRNLWRFAVEMRAVRAQECLAPLLGMRSPQERKPARPESAARPVVEEERPPAAPPEPAVVEEAASEPQASGSEEAQPPAESSVEALPPLTEAEEAEFKVKAFRAVVQDNTTVLLEVLGRLDISIWSKWQNKAGKDLLTLSQERGSSGAYSVLAKALGLVQEQKREAFEEREAVWIFAQGEVQPRRATVLEDTPEEADEVLVEYWDGDAPATRVERCLVRKMWS